MHPVGADNQPAFLFNKNQMQAIFVKLVLVYLLLLRRRLSFSLFKDENFKAQALSHFDLFIRIRYFDQKLIFLGENRGRAYLFNQFFKSRVPHCQNLSYLIV
jgi:hypothetical protein